MVTEDIDIIAVYRSRDGCLRKLLEKLQHLINFSKTTMVIRYRNICNTEKPHNLLKPYLEAKEFKLIVNKAKHIAVGLIDQTFILNRGTYEAAPDVEIRGAHYIIGYPILAYIFVNYTISYIFLPILYIVWSKQYGKGQEST